MCIRDSHHGVRLSNRRGVGWDGGVTFAASLWLARYISVRRVGFGRDVAASLASASGIHQLSNAPGNAKGANPSRCDSGAHGPHRTIQERIIRTLACAADWSIPIRPRDGYGFAVSGLLLAHHHFPVS